MRILSAVSVVAVSAVVGFVKARALSRRASSLKDAIIILEEAKSYIAYLQLPIADFIKDGAKRHDLLAAAEENVATRELWRDGWNKAVREYRGFAASDRDILLSVGAALGSSDSAGQSAVIEANIALLSQNLSRATEESDKKGGVYRSMGLYVGAAIGIVIL
ncbi:MAG: stage III sporulation protein AB [Oscillospiraceae bacterium]|jgi:stage III sporulation protein AB|nr:stage III sporulation protein AB [Oscillospiraceae bacterium]